MPGGGAPYSGWYPDGCFTMWGPEGHLCPFVCADPPSKSILPSPSVSAAWITASASSSVSGTMGPLLGMVDRMYLGPGWGWGGSGQSPGRGGLTDARWFARCSLPPLQVGKLRPGWSVVSGLGPSAVDPGSHKASWGPVGGVRGLAWGRMW